jgi:hypothetical protein
MKPLNQYDDQAFVPRYVVVGNLHGMSRVREVDDVGAALVPGRDEKVAALDWDEIEQVGAAVLARGLPPRDVERSDWRSGVRDGMDPQSARERHVRVVASAGGVVLVPENDVLAVPGEGRRMPVGDGPRRSPRIEPRGLGDTDRLEGVRVGGVGDVPKLCFRRA